MWKHPRPNHWNRTTVWDSPTQQGDLHYTGGHNTQHTPSRGTFVGRRCAAADGTNGRGTLGGSTMDTLGDTRGKHCGHSWGTPGGATMDTLGEGSWTLWWTLCGSTGGSIRQTVNGISVNWHPGEHWGHSVRTEVHKSCKSLTISILTNQLLSTVVYVTSAS